MYKQLFHGVGKFQKSPNKVEMERKSKGIVGEMGPEPVCSLSFSYRLFGTTLKQLGQVGSLEA